MLVPKQGPFVSTLLRDEALLWYRSSYENWYPATPLTWEILRAAMRQYFAPPRLGNSGKYINREKGDVSRGRQLY
jgi:hypothetical protein